MSWFDDLSEGHSNLLEINITEPPKENNKQTSEQTNKQTVKGYHFQPSN